MGVPSTEQIESTFTSRGYRVLSGVTEYKNRYSKIEVECPKNHIYLTTRGSFVKGHGCRKCAHLQAEMPVDRIVKVIGEAGYTIISGLESYRGGKSYLTVRCDKGHPQYNIRVSSFLEGIRCRRCANDGLMVNAERVAEKLKLHGLEVLGGEYKNNGKSILVVQCRNGHIVNKRVSDLLQDHGCSVCGRRAGLLSFNEVTDFIQSNGYKVVSGSEQYRDLRSRLVLECPSGHLYGTTAQNFKINNSRCATCAKHHSGSELELFQYVSGICTNVISGARILNGKEIDVYVPDLKVGVEYHGLYWHSVAGGKSNYYHKEKADMAEAMGIRLLQFYEDEWKAKRSIVESIVGHVVGVKSKRIFARKCQVRELTIPERRGFLDANHIQGDVASAWSIGLYYQNELVQILTIRKAKFTGGAPVWDIGRLATKIGCVVVGGLSKLLARAVDWLWERGVTELYTYADRRYSQGGAYKAVGFQLVKVTEPGYYYTDFTNRYHRYSLRKTDGCPINMTNDEWLGSKGLVKIYDCGQLKFRMSI